MKVQVYSRRHMKEIEPNAYKCLVSIWSKMALATQSYQDDDIPLEGWWDALKLEFDDAVEDVVEKGLTLFDEEMAKELLAFIEKNRGRDFVIHCDAGMSRSVGVASFMKEAYEYEIELFEIGTDRFRNIRIVNLLRRAWYQRILGTGDSEYGNE